MNHNESVETDARYPWQRWYDLDENVPPWRIRLGLELVASCALAAAYVATGSELVQALLFFGLLLIAWPVAKRIFRQSEPNAYWQAVRSSAYPFGVLPPAVLAMLVMIAVGSIVLDMRPGSWFWTFVLVALSFEFGDLLARRRYRLRGTEGWNDPAPIGHSVLAAVITVPLVLVLAMLLDGDNLLTASVWALGCGLGVFLVGGLLTVVVPANRAASESQG